MAKRSRKSFEVLKPCPLCNTMLRRGERLHTVVYGGRARRATEAGTNAGAGGDASGAGSSGRLQESISYIYGCPYCYPPNEHYPRYCPVCERKLGTEDYVVARMFNRSPRSHVHVLGCTRCRGPGRR
ncbi:MAG: hypothetical protein ACLFM6_04505 [Spirochaetaceae bacterium]